MNKKELNEIFERELNKDDVVMLVDGKERIGMSELGIKVVTK